MHEFHELGETVEAIGHHLQTFEEMGVKVVATGERRCKLFPMSLWISGNAYNTSIGKLIGDGCGGVINSNGFTVVHRRERLPMAIRGGDRYRLDRSTAPVVKAFLSIFSSMGLCGGCSSYRTTLRKTHFSYHRTTLVNQCRLSRGFGYKDGRVLSNTHGAILSRGEAPRLTVCCGVIVAFLPVPPVRLARWRG